MEFPKHQEHLSHAAVVNPHSHPDRIKPKQKLVQPESEQTLLV